MVNLELSVRYEGYCTTLLLVDTVWYESVILQLQLYDVEW